MANETPPTAPTATQGEPATEPDVVQVCAQCGGTDVTMEAAVRWDVDAQDWYIATLYDKSGHCDDCDADVSIDERELPPEPAPALATYTVFVRQADGRGTTHISAQEADSPEAAKELALAAAAEDWGFDPADLSVLGVIAGDAEIVTWDNDVWE